MQEILNKILSVTNKELNNLNTTFIQYILLATHGDFFHLPSGKEHYRLLMYISSLYNNCVLYDVGTYQGFSSIALSYNKTNKVISYDIKKCIPAYPIKHNLKYCIGDVTELEDLNSTQFIFLDVNHDGSFENKFYNHLHDIKWNGLLLLDDINFNEPMNQFWNNISEEKYDITKIGHWSGTGLVNFK
jgi:hypothetical protein